jgi:hypothetical protein
MNVLHSQERKDNEQEKPKNTIESLLMVQVVEGSRLIKSGYGYMICLMVYLANQHNSDNIKGKDYAMEEEKRRNDNSPDHKSIWRRKWTIR